jgi:PAS domain S-box-containing protein
MNNVGKKENTRRSALTKHYEIMCCHANDSILLIDQNLKIVECNERAAETYGYCSEDLIGMEIKMLRPDRYREEIEPTLRNSEKEDGIIYETVNQRKDGSTFPAEVSARPIKINDAEYYQIIIRDISERKKAERKIQESENRFKELFENMSSCVAVYEAVGDGDDFMFADFNKAAERVEKIRKEDIIGKSVLEVFPGIREFGLFEVFQRVRRTGIAEFKPAAFYKDGRVGGWKQNYVYKLPSGEVVAIYDDVTDKKLAEESLQKSEGLYRTIFEHTGTAMAIIDALVKSHAAVLS